MFTFLLLLLLLDGVLMSVIILLQAGKGGGLAAMGGGGGGTMADGIIGGRQAATLLTKSTWITGAIFLILALVLSVLSSRAAGPASILEDEFRPTPLSPQPIIPGETTTPPTVPGTEGTQGGGTDAGQVPPPTTGGN